MFILLPKRMCKLMFYSLVNSYRIVSLYWKLSIGRDKIRHIYPFTDPAVAGALCIVLSIFMSLFVNLQIVVIYLIVVLSILCHTAYMIFGVHDTDPFHEVKRKREKRKEV